MRVVVQARLTSSRLPGKSLLPVGGVPLALLAARRAANAGAEVVVAVPAGPLEAPLARVVEAGGFRVVPGPLHDVLGRFEAAVADLADDEVVVRLTADNCFPDGELVAEVAAALRASGAPYLGSDWPASGLPLGLAAEACTAGALRQAARAASDPYDREHVTPWLARAWPAARFSPAGWDGRLAHLRCTVDVLRDYQRVAEVFDGLADPVGAGWRELCQRLAAAAPAQVPVRWVGGRARSQLVLGTAQLGLAYGRVNRAGEPDDDAARATVLAAADAGVNCVDTARAYGRAEARVGDALAEGLAGTMEVVTKLDPLAKLNRGASAGQAQSAARESVLASCLALRTRSLPVLLLHRWAHRSAFDGAIWRELLALRADGLLGRLGASVSSPAEALAALDDPEVTHLQLPLNVLDRRWEAAGLPAAAAARPDVEVQARSVLLQGLLAAPAAAWPALGGVDAGALVGALDAAADGLGRSGRADLCLAFVRGLDWVHALVVGADDAAQVAANAAMWARPALDAAGRERVRALLPAVPDALVDPSRWS